MISENQMVNKYEVSRSVIRTAFTRLKELGFIEIYPQRGTYVKLMDLKYIGDLLILRTAVEKEVIYELFTKLGRDGRNDLIEKLEYNISEQEKCSNEKEYNGRFPELDKDFHNIMINSVNREGLIKLLSVQAMHVARWRNFDVAFDNRIPDLIKEHKKILDEIKHGRLLEAQDAMAIHLETITGIADRAVQKYPTYFIRNEKSNRHW